MSPRIERTRSRTAGILATIAVASVVIGGGIGGYRSVTNDSGGGGPELQSCSTITYPAPSGSDANIVFEFDQAYDCEQFANGDWFVVPATEGGSVTLTEVEPAMTGSGSTFRHGIVSNISQTTGNAQSFDGRVPSFTTPTISYPYTAEDGEVLLKLVSNAAVECSGGSPDNCGRFAATLTVLNPSNVPDVPEETFRPPYAWTNKPMYTFADLNPQLDLLLSLDETTVEAVSSGTDVPTRQAMLDRVLHQRYATYPSSVAVLEARDAYPPDNLSWGGDMLKKDTEIINWLMLDDACDTPPCSAQENLDAKLPVLVGYIQYGIDMWGAYQGGTNMLEGGGGNGAGKYFTAAFAATMLNSAEMKADLAGSAERDWWESYSYWRSSKTGDALWGQMPNANWTFSQWETNWWSDFPACSNCNLRDPYQYIDGGSIPGTSYQRSTMMPTKYMALVFRMVPEMADAIRPDLYEVITEYADRVVASGAQTIPDPCMTETGTYGVDHGPDGAGNCIFNTADDPNDDDGRVPSQHGDTTDGEGASRHSEFNDNFWTAFRGSF